MEFKISKERVEQIGELINDMPTKWGLPLTQILQQSLMPIKTEDDSVEDTNPIENMEENNWSVVDAEVEKHIDELVEVYTIAQVKSSDKKAVVRLSNGDTLEMTKAAFDAGDDYQKGKLVYKLK